MRACRRKRWIASRRASRHPTSTICSARWTGRFPASAGGPAERQCRVVAGINALGKEAVLEGKKARALSAAFCRRHGILGPRKVAQIPPLF